jgi:hypothetical protein
MLLAIYDQNQGNEYLFTENEFLFLFKIGKNIYFNTKKRLFSQI